MRWLSIVATAALALVSAARAPWDVATQTAVAANVPVDVFVQFPLRPRAAPSRWRGLPFHDRVRWIHHELVEHATRFQGKWLETLKAEGVDARMRWIHNALYIKNATPDVLERLSNDPRVVSIYADADVATIDAPTLVSTNWDSYAPVWNIELIGAPQVWANGTRGEGVTVANIDTGVRGTHEALRGTYRGAQDGTDDYNWYDPRENGFAPYDNNGHGTHTLGTMVGVDVGVAPGASWIAAKGCATLSCSFADLSGSFQYLLAPTPQGQYDNPSAGEPRKAPRVINNSWGGGQGSTQFLPFIQPHLEAGTIVIFSQGNSGSACSTANSPADLGDVLGVGSTDIDDALSSFSSRGPGVGTPQFPLQKPDVSAPGERIYSTYPDSDTAYATLSGTSMAGPHVAGLAALAVAIDPTLDHARFASLVKSTSVTALPTPKGGATSCGGVAYTAVPNYHYGFGRIDAVAALLRR